MYGMEVDPNEEIRRKQQVYGFPGAEPAAAPESPTGPYGVADAAPAPAAAPPAAAPPPPAMGPPEAVGAMPERSGRGMALPGMSTAPYGVGPVEALKEHQEQPRQGAIEGEKTNPYGYPDESVLRNRKRPEIPTMGRYYVGTGGVGTRVARMFAESGFEEKKAKYKNDLDAYNQVDEDYDRQYKEASHREERDYRERQFKALQEDRDIDNKQIAQRYEELKLAGDAQRAETERQHLQAEADRKWNQEERKLEEQHREDDRRRDDADRAERKAKEAQVPPSELWKESVEWATPENVPNTPQDESKAGPDLAKAKRRYDELQERANPLPSEDADPDVAEKYNNSPVIIKVKGKWGRIVNGRFVPNRIQEDPRKRAAGKPAQ